MTDDEIPSGNIFSPQQAYFEAKYPVEAALRCELRKANAEIERLKAEVERLTKQHP